MFCYRKKYLGSAHFIFYYCILLFILLLFFILCSGHCNRKTLPKKHDGDSRIEFKALTGIMTVCLPQSALNYACFQREQLLLVFHSGFQMWEEKDRKMTYCYFCCKPHGWYPV